MWKVYFSNSWALSNLLLTARKSLLVAFLGSDVPNVMDSTLIKRLADLILLCCACLLWWNSVYLGPTFRHKSSFSKALKYFESLHRALTLSKAYFSSFPVGTGSHECEGVLLQCLPNLPLFHLLLSGGRVTDLSLNAAGTRVSLVCIRAGHFGIRGNLLQVESWDSVPLAKFRNIFRPVRKSFCVETPVQIANILASLLFAPRRTGHTKDNKDKVRRWSLLAFCFLG